VKKRLICIECPNGCVLSADIEDGKVVRVSGHTCPKGEQYAFAEIESPQRILTSSVLAEGLTLKMIPVRTDGPIPKEKLFEAIEEIKRVRVREDLCPGDMILKNFLGLNVNLIATRGSI
jgi:CxxC motif-containing protein